jgi:hypothetical protein
MNLTWGGDIPHQLEFFWKFFSGFENLITLGVILRHLEAKFKHFKVLKTHRGGVISTLVPHYFFSGRNPVILLVVLKPVSPAVILGVESLAVILGIVKSYY